MTETKAAGSTPAGPTYKREAYRASGDVPNKQAGDKAVAEFLQRFDQLGDEMEELRANQNT